MTKAAFEWTPYVANETVVDFGCRYLCVDTWGKRASVRFSHEIPQSAAWIVRLSDVVNTIPVAAVETPPKREKPPAS